MEENNKKSEAALREEKVLEFWRENKIFEKSLKESEGRKEFIFYEGPPTANGKPGIHHLEARAFKDAIPRYKTMRGFHVRRKGGWDTHGLPVELQVEKKLGLNSKKAIEEYGIEKFNHECKESVWEYLDVWNRFTKRIGYWVDQDNPYVTYDNNFIESVWNIVSETHKQNLLYKDYKVVPWCPRCGTALSSHELAQGYEDVKDLSVYVKFKLTSPDAFALKEKEKNSVTFLQPTAGTFRQQNSSLSPVSTDTFILAWTTTPWTLPGNVALAVGEDVDYVKVKSGDEFYILAKARLSLLGENPEIVAEFRGKDLIGLEYEPLFPFLADIISESEKTKLEKAYKIYGANFVTTEDGTGVVHTAVMYGQDDFELGTKVGLPKHHLVNLEGKFIKGTGFLEGRFVREVDEAGKPTLAVDIIKYLTDKNLFFKKENYEHSYPHCWRCHTALIYYARDSWYVRMSDPKIKEKLISENKTINWEPAYTRDGRFGEWLREIKDWAISRERYWGTPLPVWLSSDGEKIVVDSIETLKKYGKNSGNKYFVIRHGGTEGNKKGVVSYKNQASDHLTHEGEEQVRVAIKNLKENKIDLIITSHFTRTKETAEILRISLGLEKSAVIEDPRLCEMNPGSFDGGLWQDYHNHVKDTGPNWFDRKIADGESLLDVKKRTAEALYDLEQKYQNKNIILVTHGGPAWLLFVNTGLFEPDHDEYVPASTHVFVKEFKVFKNAEIRELPFLPLPHDASFNIDLHRPYIDQVVLEKDGKEFYRTKEVMDVWFDSGAMPFAQDHYPFENKEWVEGVGYPADYICEAIDQTRGWFYTLHAVGVLMGRGKSYKNVICLGHLLDANGKKMSKSIGNVVDPWEVINKYGVDTLRLWMYSVNQPGESKNFDEKTVQLLNSQVFGLLYNVLSFYELYRDESVETNISPKSQNVLDVWILAKLDELIELMTKNLDNYKLLEPARAFKDFVGDLSTWYLRRSRERIKNGDKDAKQTLYFVLKTLSKLLAPFAPFSAEDIWLKLKNDQDVESVHLAKWPVKNIFGKIRFVFYKGRMKKIILNMKTARDIVSFGLKERQIQNLPVKQPLKKINIKVTFPKEFFSIIRDELNVKEIKQDKNLNTDVVLDSEITPELKEEGKYRELVRGLQDMRKKEGLTPSEKVSLLIYTSDEGQKLVQKFETEIKKIVLVDKIEFQSNDGDELKIDNLVFKVKIEK
ncbi:class I tRNA ligase family protein [Candidatus Nomurabacteria bacterium]|nr:class I tRNA ligase family protein [Candidatus Nomurabacteria bacterium]